MKVLARRFNIYLALAFLLGLACGCQTGKQEKEIGALRVHVEVSPDPAGTSQDISVLRSDPVLVTIKREPILTEANIVTAKVIDARGGFAIEIKFDENGTWLLEQYSAANPGRHFVIFGQWKRLARRFNIYLALAFLLGLAGGCQTGEPGKEVGALRVHLEVSPDPAGTSQNISVLRSDPVLVTIKNEPILTEANIVTAKVIDARGGFAIEIKFDENGAWLLEQYTAANPGRHFAIFGQWSEKPVAARWLAAPVITHRISNGVLAFTPDCSREEADQLVLGLNNAAKKIHKSDLK